jgi:hypothetical protein
VEWFQWKSVHWKTHCTVECQLLYSLLFYTYLSLIKFCTQDSHAVQYSGYDFPWILVICEMTSVKFCLNFYAFILFGQNLVRKVPIRFESSGMSLVKIDAMEPILYRRKSKKFWSSFCNFHPIRTKFGTKGTHTILIILYEVGENWCYGTHTLPKEVKEILVYLLQFSSDSDKIWYERYPSNLNYLVWVWWKSVLWIP